MRTIKISQGSHYPDGCFLSRFKPRWSTEEMSVTVSFAKSCLYHLPLPDQMDVNKLFGFSMGFPWRDSVRWGWRAWYAVGEDKPSGIQLMPYLHRKGKRVSNIELLDYDDKEQRKLVVAPGQEIHLNIERVLDDLVMFSAQCSDELGVYRYLAHFRNEPAYWGVLHGAYFGGNQKAPNDMEIIEYARSVS